jgi:hypothetical protein
MSQSHPFKAAAWMMGAVVSFTSMAVAGREVAIELDTFEIMTYRSILGILVVLAVCKFAGTLGQINTCIWPVTPATSSGRTFGSMRLP